jgi:hypothetical protein
MAASRVGASSSICIVLQGQEPMEKLHEVVHRGKSIFIIDLSFANPAEAIAIIRDAEPKITSCPPESVLMLTDVTKARYNQESAAELKRYAANNTPYVRGSAVVGLEGLHRVLLMAVQLLTRREIRAFSDRDAALNWLASL